MGEYGIKDVLLSPKAIMAPGELLVSNGTLELSDILVDFVVLTLNADFYT